MAFTLNRETSMGLVRLVEIATGFRYVKSISDKANGSYLDKRPEEIFCVFEDLGPPSWKLQENKALVCTPVCCTAPPIWAVTFTWITRTTHVCLALSTTCSLIRSTTCETAAQCGRAATATACGQMRERRSDPR